MECWFVTKISPDLLGNPLANIFPHPKMLLFFGGFVVCFYNTHGHFVPQSPCAMLYDEEIDRKLNNSWRNSIWTRRIKENCRGRASQKLDRKVKCQRLFTIKLFSDDETCLGWLCEVRLGKERSQANFSARPHGLDFRLDLHGRHCYRWVGWFDSEAATPLTRSLLPKILPWQIDSDLQ